MFDSSAQLLRAVCQEEAKHGYNVPDRLEEKDFSWLVEYLIKPEKRLIRGKACPGSFFRFASSQGELSSLEQSNRTKLTVKRWSESFQDDPSTYKMIIANLTKSEFTATSDGSTMHLHRQCSKQERHMNNIDVYFTTEKHDAVDCLREIRNQRIGHPNGAAMSVKVLQELYEKVKKCFEVITDAKQFVLGLQNTWKVA